MVPTDHQCPKCGSAVAQGAKKCGNCSNPLEWCPHCGHGVGRTDQVCSNCNLGLGGKALLEAASLSADERAQIAAGPNHPDTKKCPYCAEEIKWEAIVCKHCSRSLQGGSSQTQSWNPGAAAVLSVFFPGIGQVYKGEIGKGFVLLVVTIIGYFMFIVPGLLIHIFVVVDAYGGGNKSAIHATPEAIAAAAAAQEIYNRKTPEQRRAETRKTLFTLAAVIGALAVIGVATVMLGPQTGDREQTAAEVKETGQFVERRMIYNALLLGGKPADVAKRYKKTVEEVEAIQAEGKSRGWQLEDLSNVKKPR